MKGHANAGFPERRRHLARLVQRLDLDREALKRPLRRCELTECSGTCCHDGAHLSHEESRVLKQLCEEAREEFRQLGTDLPEDPIVFATRRPAPADPKTAVKPAPMRERVRDYPAHFPETSCVFLREDGKCSLQLLATKRDLHPWHFKPVTCWLHPLTIASDGGGRFRLTLHSVATDPQKSGAYPGFTGFTHCGRPCESGEPGWKVLREEIETMSEIGGRDLVGELESA